MYQTVSSDSLTYSFNVDQQRCGKEDDLTAHCQEYDNWHDEQYLKYKNQAGDYYRGADIKKCESKITKRGKYLNTHSKPKMFVRLSVRLYGKWTA